MTAKPITTIKLHMHGTKAKILPEEKAFRGRVIAAGASRITVEIEVDDDHGFRKGVPVLLLHDSDRMLEEHAARLTEEDVARFRSYLRKPGTKVGGELSRDLLKRRAKLLRRKVAG